MVDLLASAGGVSTSLSSIKDVSSGAVWAKATRHALQRPEDVHQVWKGAACCSLGGGCRVGGGGWARAACRCGAAAWGCASCEVVVGG